MSDLDALYAQLPSLSAVPHRITSPPSDDYNCVAWVERDLDRWYEPDFYWPEEVPIPRDLDDDLDEYLALFAWFGYEMCEGPEFEPGFLKIAVYADGRSFEHVAKQLRSGAWSSKAGRLHDLRHDDLEAFSGSGIMGYARPAAFMKRADDGTDPLELEEGGLLTP